MSIFGNPEDKSRRDTPSLKENSDGARLPAAQPRTSSVSDVQLSRSSNQTPNNDKPRSIIREDMTVKGTLTNGQNVEIHGLVEGDVSADQVSIGKTGRLLGSLNSDNAIIDGIVEGEVKVKHLIRISESGSVTGDIEYGELALEAGGELSAVLRNVPPKLDGDLELSVKSGQSVTITTEDLTAIDPDNDASELTYSVSRVSNGHLARSTSPELPIDKFTQAEIESNTIQFVHSGEGLRDAGFNVIVTDSEGASSGTAKRVLVSIKS